MSEYGEIIRILSEAVVYKPLKNPNATEKVVKQWLVRARWVFGSLIALVFALNPPKAGVPIVWTTWPPNGVLYLVITLGVAYAFIEPVITHRRRAHRAIDEAHHQLARWAIREPQVAALAVHSADVLEDLQDQYQARLATGLGRLSVFVGEKAAVLTIALGVMGAYKAITDFKWISPTSPAVGAFLGLGIVVAMLPALTRAFSERQIYQCDLLAAALKRKRRDAASTGGAAMNCAEASKAPDAIDAPAALQRPAPISAIEHARG